MVSDDVRSHSPNRPQQLPLAEHSSRRISPHPADQRDHGHEIPAGASSTTANRVGSPPRIAPFSLAQQVAAQQSSAANGNRCSGAERYGFIAATALVHGLVLVTRNLAESSSPWASGWSIPGKEYRVVAELPVSTPLAEGTISTVDDKPVVITKRLNWRLPQHYQLIVQSMSQHLQARRA